jgi:hypothetical protein
MAAILSVSDVAEYTALSMWKVTFDRGFYLCPTQAMFSSFIFFLNAFLTFLNGLLETSSQKRVYMLLIAGVLAISLVPFTLVMIAPREEALLERHRKLSREGPQTVAQGKLHNNAAATARAIESRRVMETWVSMNYFRTILPALTVFWIWWMCV